MKCKYDVENVFTSTLSFEQTKEIICKKIARIIIIMENVCYGNK